MKLSYQQTALLDEAVVRNTIEPLSKYRERLGKILMSDSYREHESSIRLPFDNDLLLQVEKAASEIRTPTLQYVIVVGIGGSNLGAQAIYDTIAGSMSLLVDRLPKVVFIDTVTDEKMTALIRVLERLSTKDDFAMIIISKSGTTTETIANAEVIIAFLQEQFRHPFDRISVITDEGSKLSEIALQKGMRILTAPAIVCGRFSVFSAVGLLPLALAGIDIRELIRGAQRAVNDGLSENHKKNYSIVSAALNWLHFEMGRNIHNTFLFSPRLESLGKWYRQLISESLGKDGKGMTPIVSIGSTDLHSMSQLFWGGPDDKFTNLICSFTGDVNSLPYHLALPGLVKGLQGKSLETIMEAIFEGVSAAYERTKRPFALIDLGTTDPESLGYYLQFRMIEIMYTAVLMGVNAFDQPEVELYKEVTRRKLSD